MPTMQVSHLGPPISIWANPANNPLRPAAVLLGRLKRIYINLLRDHCQAAAWWVGLVAIHDSLLPFSSVKNLKRFKCILAFASLECSEPLSSMLVWKCNWHAYITCGIIHRSVWIIDGAFGHLAPIEVAIFWIFVSVVARVPTVCTWEILMLYDYYVLLISQPILPDHILPKNVSQCFL